MPGRSCFKKKPFGEYVSDFNWYNVNTALIRNQKVNIDEGHTQDVFILNMSHNNNIRKYVVVERYLAHAYITNQYKEGNFKKFIAQIYGTLSVRNSNTGGRYNCSRSQTNVHIMILCGNNEDDPVKYNYCCPRTNPDFSSYHTLMYIAYSGCNENKLEYEACQYE